MDIGEMIHVRLSEVGLEKVDSMVTASEVGRLLSLLNFVVFLPSYQLELGRS